MSSPLNTFMRSGAEQSNQVIGTDSLTVNLGGGMQLVIDGVWGMVTQQTIQDEGGFMPEVDATLVCIQNDNITKDLIGKTATAKGEGFRIANIDIGEVETTIYVVNETQIL